MNSTATLDVVWRDVLASSHRALIDVLDNIDDNQWTFSTPCSDWNVAQVVQHAAGDQLAYAAALGVGPGPTDNPFAPTGEIVGSARELIRTAVQQSASAWSTVADTTVIVPTPLPHGDLATPVAATLCALDAAVHAWDLAIATGQSSPMNDELAAHLLAAARTTHPAPGTGIDAEIIEPLRQWGAYGPIVVGESRGALNELLRYLGRNPQA